MCSSLQSTVRRLSQAAGYAAAAPAAQLAVMASVRTLVADWTVFAAAGFLGCYTCWFFFKNYLVPENMYPLDFYSNKLRTKPWTLLVLLGYFVALFALLIFPGQQLFYLSDILPELVISIAVQGIVLGMLLLLRVSAAAAMTGTMIYTVVSAGLVFIVTVPTISGTRPGVWYSNFFLVAFLACTAWMHVGSTRHVGRDGQPGLPEGAERLPSAWSTCVCRGTPVLLILTNMLYFAHDRWDLGQSGAAVAMVYYLIAGILMIGCCTNFRSGTVVEG